MNYAFIKDNICVNIVVFGTDEDVKSFKQYIPNIDKIVLLEDGFGIGDKYENEIWTKAEPIPEPPKEPTVDERVQALEEAMLFMTLGGI